MRTIIPTALRIPCAMVFDVIFIQIKSRERIYKLSVLVTHFIFLSSLPHFLCSNHSVVVIEVFSKKGFKTFFVKHLKGLLA